MTISISGRPRPHNENYNARTSGCNAARESFRKSLKRFRSWPGRQQQTARPNSSIDGGWITLAFPRIKYKVGAGQVRFIRMI